MPKYRIDGIVSALLCGFLVWLEKRHILLVALGLTAYVT